MAIVETDREVEVLKARVRELEGRERALLDAASEDIARYKARVNELELQAQSFKDGAVEAAHFIRRKDAQVAELSCELEALQSALRWRPIAEWPEEGLIEVAGSFLDCLGNRCEARVTLRAEECKMEFWAKKGHTHFRPVLPGPEGPACR